MSSEDKTRKLGELKTELVRLKTMIGAGGTIEDPARVKALRRAIAKILTIEHEQKLGIGKVKAERKKQK
jgi:large subunit ribosomal protein L29